MSAIEPVRSSYSRASIISPPGQGRVSTPDGRILSPDILKRIIEGHETTEIFDECLDTRDYNDRADLLVNELSKYLTG